MVRYIGTALALTMCASVFLFVGGRRTGIAISLLLGAVLTSIAYERAFATINDAIAIPGALAVCGFAFLGLNAFDAVRRRLRQRRGAVPPQAPPATDRSPTA